ncbi:MAG: phasin family protein [Proteobacteria bacterium]|nr:phasin family protein [Pseudomonadota bacterium]
MSNNPSNPFFSPDLTKFMDMTKFVDPSKLMDMSKFGDISKMMSECKMPNMDVESLMATQRKSLEAIASNNQKAMEGLQSYMSKQAELARQSFEAAQKLVQDVVAAPTPQEKIAKQVEATKSNIENCMSSLKELSELLSASHMQNIQVVSDAVVESMDGLQDMIKK